MQSGTENSNNTKLSHSRLTPVVDCPSGPVQGLIDGETGTHSYLGIPYAQPPVDDLRWQPPQPMATRKSLLQATRFGMPAAQNPSLLMEVKGPNGEEPESEDCLYLNIFTPPQCEKTLPVMLWLHGGSFYMGAGSQDIYHGRHLAASGRAIVVTLNYRLGALGFLRLADITDIPATGNEGMLDQIAALHWVRSNISAFGGDPERITLFGESAGAMSISALLAVPDCDGLFQRAIIQSGHPGALHSIERANDAAGAFIAHLFRESGKSPREASTRDLLRAQAALLSDERLEKNWGQLPFKPVLDGKMLREKPAQALREGRGREVELMLGSNLEEWNLFSAANPDTFSLDSKKIRERLGWLLPSEVLDPLLRHYYSVASSLTGTPWPEWSRTWNLLLTDMVFTLPGLRLLDAHGGKQFHYHFAQPLSAQPLLGACHAVELGYVFGTHGEATLQHLYGDDPAAHELSNNVRTAWLNFAEHGHPGPDWPVFSDGHSQRLGHHPCGPELDAASISTVWQDVPDHLIDGYL